MNKMMRNALLTTASFVATALPGAAADAQVLVCLETAGLVHGQALTGAKAQAVEIFAGIGVQLIWARGSVCRENSIVIKFVAEAPAGVGPSALGVALPFGKGGPNITIFCDHVKDLVGPQQGWSAPVLGHVIAHEIGHILLATDAHSATGLMSARWTLHEISRMSRTPLEFTPLHAQMIQQRLQQGVLNAAIR